MNPFGILCDLVTVYFIVLIVRIILSWVPDLPEPLRPAANLVSRLTDPVLQPVRGLLPAARVGPAAIDFSPIIVFLVLSLLVRPLVCGLTGGGLLTGGGGI